MVSGMASWNAHLLSKLELILSGPNAFLGSNCCSCSITSDVVTVRLVREALVRVSVKGGESGESGTEILDEKYAARLSACTLPWPAVI